MPEFDRVVIIGVGLLGGSVGLALRHRSVAGRVVGVSRRASTLQSALAMGAIDEAADSLAAGVAQADLAIVCTPVQQIAQFVEQCQPAMPAGGLITDVGSTKRSLCEQLAEVAPLFCGSHPLAGSDKSGVEHARSDLFVDRLCVVTPRPATPEELTARTERLWQLLGSRTMRMSPDDHDAAIATTSHLPHVVAAALAAATPTPLLPLAASGWCDTTRVAAGSVELWLQILAENRSHVLATLKDFSRTLDQWAEALDAGDDMRLAALLTAGKKKRDALGN
jgi:prephenate dehydrogenase